MDGTTEGQKEVNPEIVIYLDAILHDFCGSSHLNQQQPFISFLDAPQGKATHIELHVNMGKWR